VLGTLFTCAAPPPWVPPEPSVLLALQASPAPSPAPIVETQHIGSELDPLLAQKLAVARGDASIGRKLGVFRNTYYDFPLEREYTGPLVDVFDASCRSLARVPQEFHDTLCMQGSGLLADGRPLSFARRDCSCARRCPRSSQQICFEALAPERYPWGRGAAGDPITPLLSVAVDIDVIPLARRYSSRSTWGCRAMRSTTPSTTAASSRRIAASRSRAVTSTCSPAKRA